MLRGDGRLDGPGRVRVGHETYTARHVVLATGSDPVVPPVPGLRGLDGVWTNREATGLTEVPRRLLVLGGGPVGLELGQAIARMGASVAIVEGAPTAAGPRAAAARRGRRRGAGAPTAIELHLGRHASAARARGRRPSCSSSTAARSCAATALLVATGRRPRVDGLGLETVGLRPASRSTRACAPATGCGRSATSPASGR